MQSPFAADSSLGHSYNNTKGVAQNTTGNDNGVFDLSGTKSGFVAAGGVIPRSAIAFAGGVAATRDLTPSEIYNSILTVTLAGAQNLRLPTKAAFVDFFQGSDLFDDAQDIGVVVDGAIGKRGLSFTFTIINDDADGGDDATLVASSDGFSVPGTTVATTAAFYVVPVASVRTYTAIYYNNLLQVYPMN